MPKEKIDKTGFLKNVLRKSLRSKLARGSIWLTGGNFAEQGLRFTRNIVLTRLMCPDDLGLMTIILGINNGLEAFTQVGIKEAVIQNSESENIEFQNAAWWLSFIRATALLLTGIAITPLLVKFFNISFTPIILVVSFLHILFANIISPAAFVSLKRMNYSKWVIISQGGSILGVLTTIIIVYICKNPWGLIIGYVCEAGFKMILSFILCPFKIKLKINPVYAKSLLQFSRGMIGLPLLFFIYQSADIFVVGKFFSKYEVGLYGMARSLARNPTLLTSVLVGPLLMPLLSKHQDSFQKTNNILLISTFALSALTSPFVILAIFFGKELLSIIYGSQYMVMAVPFAVILSVTILQMISSPVTTAFIAGGKPQYHRFFTLVRAVLMICLIFPAVRFYGLNGAAAAGLVSMCIAFIFQCRKINSITGINIADYLKAFGVPFILSLAVLILAFLFSHEIRAPHAKIIVGLSFCVIPWILSVKTFLKMKKTAELSNETGKAGLVSEKSSYSKFKIV